jgi:hypothetical protein
MEPAAKQYFAPPEPTGRADRRPTGLTALAALSFVSAGVNLVYWLIIELAIGLLRVVDKVLPGEPSITPDDRAQFAAIKAGFMLALVVSGLLIAGGVGLLRERRVLGRKVASIAALLALGLGVYAQVVILQHFEPISAASMIFPLILLVLVNTRFRSHLTA